MPESIKEPLIEKTFDICSRLSERKTELLSEVSSVEAAIDSVYSIEELLSIYDNIEELLDYRFEEEVEKRLESIAKKIEEVQSRIEEAPGTLDEIEELITSCDDGDSYDRVYYDSLIKHKEKLLNDEQQWINKTLRPAEEVDSLDAQRCTLYIDRLRCMPLFVSQKTAKRVQQAIAKVEGKLHECKVQGVLSLFNALSDEEKNEFLRIITEKGERS